MMKYGIDNVRGGSYTKLKLDDWMIKSLEHEFISAQDICYNCNKKGHFVKDCPYNIKKYLESFTDIMKINNELRQLESTYKKIIILNTQITQCDSIEKDKQSAQYRYEKRFGNSEEQVNSVNSAYNNAINSWYRKNFNHHNEMYLNTEINIDIKKYKFKIFHLERKKELKDIFNIHISEELVKMKLIGLFEMKINILNSI
jgi:hypothetical protein